MWLGGTVMALDHLGSEKSHKLNLHHPYKTAQRISKQMQTKQNCNKDKNRGSVVNSTYSLISVTKMYHVITSPALSVKPSSGTGVPHLRSRVMQRVFRPLFSHESAILFAFDVHVPSEKTFCRWVFKRPASCKQHTQYSNRYNNLT